MNSNKIEIWSNCWVVYSLGYTPMESNLVLQAAKILLDNCFMVVKEVGDYKYTDKVEPYTEKYISENGNITIMNDTSDRFVLLNTNGLKPLSDNIKAIINIMEDDEVDNYICDIQSVSTTLNIGEILLPLNMLEDNRYVKSVDYQRVYFSSVKFFNSAEMVYKYCCYKVNERIIEYLQMIEKIKNNPWIIKDETMDMLDIEIIEKLDIIGYELKIEKCLEIFKFIEELNTIIITSGRKSGCGAFLMENFKKKFNEIDRKLKL